MLRRFAGQFLAAFFTILISAAIAKGGSAPSTLTWVKLKPATSPSGRAAFAMGYDPVSKKIVLFGGFNAAGYLNETWTFDGTTWTRINTKIAPSGRAGIMLAYDAPTKKLVLFGGFANPKTLDDTWLWDGATSQWTHAKPTTSPPPRFAALMFTDPKTGHAGFFGGHQGVGDPGDTWLWTGSNWRRMHPVNSPLGREYAPVALDPLAKNVVITGGSSQFDTQNTWTWDGSNWTQQSPATQIPYIFATSATYDPDLKQVILFGGAQNTGIESQTWVWTGDDWEQMPITRSPSARVFHGIAYDSAKHELIVFGGTDAVLGLGNLFNDTWKLVVH